MKVVSFVIVSQYALGIFCNADAYFGAFTSYANLEKLYTLEDDLITISDVIMSHERALHGDSDVHGIYNISDTVEVVKNIHREIISNRNLTSYLNHPINVYHLVKRLSFDWGKVIGTLEERKSCAKAMRVKIENMADNVPSGKHLKMIIRAILKMQAVYNISTSDVTSGKFENVTGSAYLSLDDAFAFARVAYETDKQTLAIDWLKFVIENYNVEVASFNLTNALNLLSSAYLKMDQPNKALETLEELLKIDSTNVAARRNIKYIINKMDDDVNSQQPEDAASAGSKDRKPKASREKKLNEFCSSRVITSTPKVQQFCVLVRNRTNRDLFDRRATIRTEVLSLNPLIVVFRNLTTPRQQKALANLGYEKMTKILFKSKYTSPNGIGGMILEDSTYLKWVSQVQKVLLDIDITYSPHVPSHFFIKNVGMEGCKSQPLTRFERDVVGTFYVFLSEPSYRGGDFVFPRTKVRVKPEKGSVLFIEKTANKDMTICPVIADTEWGSGGLQFAWQGFTYGLLSGYCNPSKEAIKKCIDLGPILTSDVSIFWDKPKQRLCGWFFHKYTFLRPFARFQGGRSAVLRELYGQPRYVLAQSS